MCYEHDLDWQKREINMFNTKPTKQTNKLNVTKSLDSNILSNIQWKLIINIV